ncbi:MAG: hypothetical protein ABSD28_10885 [Tepidisphaeraceae bacterium]|jgi:lipopolysaccharide export system protein LptA
MRKILLILVTLIALAGAFAAYLHFQPKYGGSMGGDNAPDSFPANAGDPNALIKPGSGAWVKQFDREGQLYYQFKSDYYDPQPDGTVKVTYPVIRFYLSDDQILQIEGDDGVIRFAPGTDKGVMSNSPTDPPRNGNLRNVKVKLFASPALQQKGDAEMTMTMTNAEFDNDTFRLFTEEFVDSAGKTVHAEDVPVTVRARDYSFVGTGLVLYWNDLDKRLKSLEMAHGTDLTISNAGEFSAQPATAAPAVPAAPATAAIAAPAAAVAPTTEPAETQQRYTATFFDNVQVLHNGDHIEAGRMDVDFATKSQSSAAPDNPPASTTASTTAPAAANVEASSRPATTAPSPEPIHVHWTGVMRLVPTDPANAEPLPDGKAIVRLIGAPVKVHQAGTDRNQWIDIACSDLSYRTGDSAAHLSGNVLLKQTNADGVVSTVAGQNLDFSRLTHTANLDGPGQTCFPDPNDPKSVLKADWTRSCNVKLHETDSHQMQIEGADLEGNVVVDHPRFHLTATDNVQLKFDSGGEAFHVPSSSDTGQPASLPLRRIIANGDADCIVNDAEQKTRKIRGQRLELDRRIGPDGKLYAKTILCNGSVHAEQNDQSLTAEDLQIELLPTKSANNAANDLGGDAALDRLIASNEVVVKGKDGSWAKADNLDVQMVDAHPRVKLEGSAERPAVVRNKTSTLTGPTIKLSPHDQTAQIDGPGTFDGLAQPKNPSEQPRPLKLSWQRNAWLDGKTNRVEVVGGVLSESHEPGGSHDSSSSDRIVATLVDVAPTTEPATRPEEGDSFAEGADFMKNKQVKLLSLQTDEPESSNSTSSRAKVKSYLLDAGGYLLREFDLLAGRIDYDVSTKRLSVAGPGDILAIEQSPPATRPAGDNASAIGGHGSTAIDWKKRFIYDDAARSAIIQGDITIVHQDNTSKTGSVRLDHADIVQAEFEAAPPGLDAGDTGEPATPKLKHLTATGAMTVRTTDKTIFCGELDFDPVEQVLTCLGGEKMGKVTVVDNDNLAGGTCAEAVFNLKTNELKKMTEVTAHGR